VYRHVSSWTQPRTVISTQVPTRLQGPPRSVDGRHQRNRPYQSVLIRESGDRHCQTRRGGRHEGVFGTSRDPQGPPAPNGDVPSLARFHGVASRISPGSRRRSREGLGDGAKRPSAVAGSADRGRTPALRVATRCASCLPCQPRHLTRGCGHGVSLSARKSVTADRRAPDSRGDRWLGRMAECWLAGRTRPSGLIEPPSVDDSGADDVPGLRAGALAF
jgi:hypothetical protein